MESKTHIQPSNGTINPTNKLESIILRTPEDRFQNLKDWDYSPLYVNNLKGFENLRMHYIDTGKPDARRTLICLHGQRTWSYAFRKTIPYFVRNSFRVIALDLFGFGKSDKFANDMEYSFEFHRDSVISFIEQLDLKECYISGFDWGGWIGATLPMSMPQRISGLILGNMALHTAEEELWPGFHLWKSLHNANNNPNIAESFYDSNIDLLSSELTAYNAPFPDFRYKAAIRKFPNLVPLETSDPTAIITKKAIDFLHNDWKGRCVCIAGLQDPVLGEKSMEHIHAKIRNAKPMIKVAAAGPLIFENAADFIPKAIELIQ